MWPCSDVNSTSVLAIWIANEWISLNINICPPGNGNQTWLAGSSHAFECFWYLVRWLSQPSTYVCLDPKIIENPPCTTFIDEFSIVFHSFPIETSKFDISFGGLFQAMFQNPAHILRRAKPQRWGCWPSGHQFVAPMGLSENVGLIFPMK